MGGERQQEGALERQTCLYLPNWDAAPTRSSFVSSPSIRDQCAEKKPRQGRVSPKCRNKWGHMGRGGPNEIGAATVAGDGKTEGEH